MLKNIKKEQSGRSMVEMLGVLAVIGVLSVGGIAGYTKAMTKHKANEVLNAASIRAMAVASQIQSGASTLSLDEFSGETVTGATFGTPETSGTKQFKLNLTSVDPEVCSEMVNIVGTSGNVNIGTCPTETGALVLTYNNDLSAPVTITLSGSQGDPCGADNPCVDGCQTCNNGYCEDTCTSSQVCVENGSHTGYQCSDLPDECSSCTSSQYCFVGSSKGDCSVADSGTCVDIESDEDFEGKKVTITFSDDTTLDVYKIGSKNWWSAKNWCAAHNKQMVSLSDLHCTTSTCEDWTALSKALRVGYFWTKNAYNSCRAYNVRVDSRDLFKGVERVERHDNGASYYALCK